MKPLLAALATAAVILLPFVRVTVHVQEVHCWFDLGGYSCQRS